MQTVGKFVLAQLVTVQLQRGRDVGQQVRQVLRLSLGVRLLMMQTRTLRNFLNDTKALTKLTSSSKMLITKKGDKTYNGKFVQQEFHNFTEFEDRD